MLGPKVLLTLVDTGMSTRTANKPTIRYCLQLIQNSRYTITHEITGKRLGIIGYSYCVTICDTFWNTTYWQTSFSCRHIHIGTHTLLVQLCVQLLLDTNCWERQNETRYRGLDASSTLSYRGYDFPATFHVVMAIRTKTSRTPRFRRSVNGPLTLVLLTYWLRY